MSTQNFADAGKALHRVARKYASKVFKRTAGVNNCYQRNYDKHFKKFFWSCPSIKGSGLTMFLLVSRQKKTQWKKSC